MTLVGLGSENEVLDSVEFFDLLEEKWVTTSALKAARTEHVMGLVYGIPTVIGGQLTSYVVSKPASEARLLPRAQY